MNFLKRTVFSIMNRPKNTLSLFVIFLVLSSLILSGVSVRAACEASIEEIKASIGADIILTKGGSVDFLTFEERNSVPRETAENISDIEGIADTSLSVVFGGFAESFEPIATEEQLAEYGHVENLTVLAETDSSRASAFYEGSASLVEGRHITKDDSQKVVIHASLAAQNELEIGESMSFKCEDTVLECEIVGIFATEEVGSYTGVVFDEPENAVYISQTDAEAFGYENITRAIYAVDDPDEANDIVSAAREICGSEADSLAFAVENSEYLQVAGPLNNVTGITAVMVLASVVMGAAILILLVMLSLRSRDREIGILLAMGEAKWRILSQLILEVLLPMLLAVSVSALLGDIVCSAAANILGVEETAVAVRPEQTALIYLCGLGFTLLASLSTAIKVMRFAPARILRDND